MDFRLDADEHELALQASLSFARALPLERLVAGGPVDAGWRTLGRDGWLTGCSLPGALTGGAELVTLALIGRAGGRTLAGDGFVNNALLIPHLLAAAGRQDVEADLQAAPGFLVADARAARLEGRVGEPVPFCVGVEPGLAAYVLDGRELLRFAAGDWQLAPAGGLALGAGAVTVSASARLERLGQVADPPPALVRAAQVVHGAALVGAAERALADSVEYAKFRHQFGRPIGAYQAVKHELADIAVAIEVGWNAVLYAALRADRTSVAAAHVQAAEAACRAARVMTQVFGGIAMTWEHHAHVVLKTVEVSRWRFGDVASQLDLVADEDFAEVRG